MAGTTYWRAPEVEEIAELLIPEHHQDLTDMRIHYLFRAPAARRSGKVKYWELLNEKQRVALVDHELCHFEVIEDDEVDGGRRLATRGHDLEEFTAVVERHGLWRPEVEAFAGAAIGAQLELSLTDVRDGSDAG
ncbi:putative metallopeptidase [Jiangella alkaliphila]|uniref:Putative phage metallopeptidase domain-containing protein n=1 Tax=Jiangella alkaliphila TaxID=419479 RepID=A0A1H2IE66_9ACTN|nr:putative metallopeptidase [Jiangella alkaliphila]SDU42295.1 hypothetical protein SAMN04488563_1639 [Jiangella alkaliphila]